MMKLCYARGSKLDEEWIGVFGRNSCKMVPNCVLSGAVPCLKEF